MVDLNIDIIFIAVFDYSKHGFLIEIGRLRGHIIQHYKNLKMFLMDIMRNIDIVILNHFQQFSFKRQDEIYGQRTIP